MQQFPVLCIDFFLCPPSACTLLPFAATFSLLTPPQTLPAVFVQTPRQRTQNRKENIEEHFFKNTHCLRTRRGWCGIKACWCVHSDMLGVFGIIYVSDLFILMEEKERKLSVTGTGERTSGRGWRGEIEELQIVTGRLMTNLTEASLHSGCNTTLITSFNNSIFQVHVALLGPGCVADWSTAVHVVYCKKWN